MTSKIGIRPVARKREWLGGKVDEELDKMVQKIVVTISINIAPSETPACAPPPDPYRVLMTS